MSKYFATGQKLPFNRQKRRSTTGLLVGGCLPWPVRLRGGQREERRGSDTQGIKDLHTWLETGCVRPCGGGFWHRLTTTWSLAFRSPKGCDKKSVHDKLGLELIRMWVVNCTHSIFSFPPSSLILKSDQDTLARSKKTSRLSFFPVIFSFPFVWRNLFPWLLLLLQIHWLQHPLRNSCDQAWLSLVGIACSPFSLHPILFWSHPLSSSHHHFLLFQTAVIRLQPVLCADFSVASLLLLSLRTLELWSSSMKIIPLEFLSDTHTA